MNRSRINRVSCVALATACACLLFAGSALAQAKKPISKQGLINAVKINSLSTADLVTDIQARGVDFKMTTGNESQLRAAGATTEVIEAARANYRPRRKRSHSILP
jgi:hypothetical protein